MVNMRRVMIVKLFGWKENNYSKLYSHERRRYSQISRKRCSIGDVWVRGPWWQSPAWWGQIWDLLLGSFYSRAVQYHSHVWLVKLKLVKIKYNLKFSSHEPHFKCLIATCIGGWWIGRYRYGTLSSLQKSPWDSVTAESGRMYVHL